MRTIGWPDVRRRTSETMIGAASAATRSSHGKPNQMAANTTGPRTAAEATRSRTPRYCCMRPGPRSAADTTIATFTSAKLRDRLFQMLLAEVRPERIDKHQLGVSALPQQKIADALLAAGAD